MKEKSVRLDELCLAEFIDIACGEYGGLAERVGLPASSEKVQKLASSLIVSYRGVADPVGMRMFVNDHGSEAKERAKMVMFGLMKALVDNGEPDDVKEVRRILAEDIGRSRCGRMSVEELSAFLGKELKSVEFSVERKKAKKDASTEAHRSPDDVRLGFDAEIAWVMSHYKMSIDTRVVSASVSANLVKNAVAEVKMKQKVKK